jgi:hypothetical protein
MHNLPGLDQLIPRQKERKDDNGRDRGLRTESWGSIQYQSTEGQVWRIQETADRKTSHTIDDDKRVMHVYEVKHRRERITAPPSRSRERIKPADACTGEHDKMAGLEHELCKRLGPLVQVFLHHGPQRGVVMGQMKGKEREGGRPGQRCRPLSNP